MKLILHIGTHKTATTTIQRELNSNHSLLMENGIWYPRYSEIMPEITDHYAHLDLAKGFMGEECRFTLKTVKEFFCKAFRKS